MRMKVRLLFVCCQQKYRKKKIKQNERKTDAIASKLFNKKFDVFYIFFLKWEL